MRNEILKESGSIVMWVVGLIVVLIFGGLYLVNRQSAVVERVPLDLIATPVVIEETGALPVANSTEAEESIVEETVMTKVMTDVDSLSGSLTDISGGQDSGTAYVLRKNEQLRHVVSATLPALEAGTFYEGWLVKKSPKLEFISTGKMIQQVDGTYQLSFNSANLYEGFNDVVITLETKDDEQPEKHILEGTVQ